MIPGHNIQQSGCCVFDFSSPHQLALGSTAFAASPLSVWPSHSLGHLLVLAVAAGASVVVETPIVCKLFTEIAVQRTETHVSRHAHGDISRFGEREPTNTATETN